MRLSGKQARSLPIPAVLDAVGVACSPLRLKYARSLIRERQPSIVKVNISELLALCGAEAHPIGIDAGKQDAVSPETRGAALSFFSAFSPAIPIVAAARIQASNGLDTAEKAAVRAPAMQPVPVIQLRASQPFCRTAAR